MTLANFAYHLTAKNMHVFVDAKRDEIRSHLGDDFNDDDVWRLMADLLAADMRRSADRTARRMGNPAQHYRAKGKQAKPLSTAHARAQAVMAALSPERMTTSQVANIVRNANAFKTAGKPAGAVRDTLNALAKQGRVVKQLTRLHGTAFVAHWSLPE